MPQPIPCVLYSTGPWFNNICLITLSIIWCSACTSDRICPSERPLLFGEDSVVLNIFIHSSLIPVGRVPVQSKTVVWSRPRFQASLLILTLYQKPRDGACFPPIGTRTRKSGIVLQFLSSLTAATWYDYFRCMHLKVHCTRFLTSVFFSSKAPTWSPDSYPKFVLNIKSNLPRYSNYLSLCVDSVNAELIFCFKLY
jgi:hypothetical protein